MRIYFLTPEQAHPRLQDLHINPGCTKAHHGSILHFNASQKTLLLYLMKEIEHILPCSVGKVEFVLLQRGVYWNFPFTWGPSMIMVTEELFAKPRHTIKKILVHEWVHLSQRRSPAAYEQYYRTLGFRKNSVDFGALAPYVLRNPDADHYEWIWLSPTGKVYAPVALLESCNFHTVLLELRDIGSARYGDDTRVIIHQIESVPEYYERFGTTKQLYHPNEITAHLIADYLVDGVKYVPIDYSELSRVLGS